MSIITLDEAKRKLRIASTDDTEDGELQAYVDGITAVVEDYKREVIELRMVTEDIEAHGKRFRLWSRPIVALTSVEAVNGSQTWNVSDMRVSPSGIVRVLSGPPLRGLVEVSYQAGYVDVPENYRRGALTILQHNWETRRGVGSVAMGVVGVEERYDHRYSYSIPRKALEWLGAPTPVVG